MDPNGKKKKTNPNTPFKKAKNKSLSVQSTVKNNTDQKGFIKMTT